MLFDVIAYTDPGTGALIWQLLAATGIGFIFYFKRYLRWISKLFKKEKKPKKPKKIKKEEISG